MRFPQEWTNRINRWLETMPRLFYKQTGTVKLEGFITKEQLTVREASKRRFKPMPEGTEWGAKWEYAWFRTRIVIPKSLAGERVVLRTDLYGDESAIYVNGVNAGARDWDHKEILLSEKARGGERFDIMMESYAGHGPRECGGGPCPDGMQTVPEPSARQAKVGVCSYGIWEEELYQLWLDMQVLNELMNCMSDKESLRISAIRDGLRDATMVVDLELPRAEMMKTVRKGRAMLKPLLNAVNGSTAPFMHAFGHSHIDVAWLWPLRETEAKCTRTFGTQLKLMEQYPEYKYLQSQPHVYQMMKSRYPELYARIKKAVAKGQWIPDGGMWVEADTNISGGESLIRQFMHGKRFFKNEFGVNSELMWLPDVFGYSGALPQIMAGCGIKYFSTQKIFWTYEGGDLFPHNYFWWEGIDGTRTLAYLHNDYCSRTSPEHIIARWNERVQKDSGHAGRLLPFGHGDGGGGPTRNHLEHLRRLKDLEGCPKCYIDAPAKYFSKAKPKNIPTWVGELYFQAHRGTYTSQAKTKLGNRKSELALRDAEMWGVAAQRLAGYKYPLSQADALWKAVLLNQFHDIIPGSSITRVYQEAEASYRNVIEESKKITNDASKKLVKTNKDEVTVFNSLSWCRDELVELPSSFKGAETVDGDVVEVQKVDGKQYGLIRCIPSCGWISIKKSEAQQSSSAMSVSAKHLENELIKVRLNDSGEIISVVDKETGGEFAAGVCNKFAMYKDVPNNFDAWDICSMYRLQPVDLDKKAVVKVKSNGHLLVSVLVSRVVGKSQLTQEIILRKGSRRIDFRTKVDWKESHKLLKVDFPVAVRSEDALHDIQFGHVRRPTHESKNYDATRFEVCNHKWTALAEENRGAAVLNDCKYGINVQGSSINLTLLKSALAPDMFADKGVQEFTYSFYCWNGAFKDSGVIQEAYELNVPVKTISGKAETKELLTTSDRNVIVESVKPAEDGSGDVVVRLYEAARTSVECELNVNIPFKKAYFVNMLEEIIKPILSSDSRLDLSFRPFEIKTLRFQK